MKRYAFFIDIDGTLLDSSSHVSDENRASLHRAQALGHKVFINTGRGLACVPDEIRSLPLNGIVAGCGCTLIYEQELVASSCVDNQFIYQYLRGIFDQGGQAFLEGENCLFRVNCSPSSALPGTPLGEYCRKARLDFDIWQPLENAEAFLQYPQARIPKLNLVGAYTQRTLYSYQNHFDGVVDDVKCEMYTKGHNKATGMQAMLTRYIPGFCSVAIGDSVNDLDMLGAADISVAMGNADAAVQEMCMIHTASADQNGVGKAIIQLLKE